jgi:hypothetical protein
MPEIDTSLDGLVGGGNDTENTEVSLDSDIDEIPSTNATSD